MKFRKGDRVVVRTCPGTAYSGQQNKPATIERYDRTWPHIVTVRLDDDPGYEWPICESYLERLNDEN